MNSLERLNSDAQCVEREHGHGGKVVSAPIIFCLPQTSPKRRRVCRQSVRYDRSTA